MPLGQHVRASVGKLMLTPLRFDVWVHSSGYLTMKNVGDVLMPSENSAHIAGVQRSKALKPDGERLGNQRQRAPIPLRSDAQLGSDSRKIIEAAA